MFEYCIISESAVDFVVSDAKLTKPSHIFEMNNPAIRMRDLGQGVAGFGTGRETLEDYCALIDSSLLEKLLGPADLVYARIARVLKSAARPPVHLPRSWAEFHFRNRLTFFAFSEGGGDQRWLVEIDSGARVVKFLGMSDNRNRINLADWVPPTAPEVVIEFRKWIEELKALPAEVFSEPSFSEQVDLKVIGSDAVLQGNSYADWLRKLKDEQKRIVLADINTSIRVVGPAGSGKTLALCMRAVHLAQDSDVIGGRKKILIVTHSWAMTERIYGTIEALAEGHVPSSISVLPLLYILQNHAGSIGQVSGSVLGEDSAEGQRKVMELIGGILTESGIHPGHVAQGSMSSSLVRALESKDGSHARNELIFDLYQEIIGVISAQGIMPGDGDAIANYLTAARDADMPPFLTRADREFCVSVFERLLERLIDLGSVTTDQLVLDCIKVFETFSWNVRRETDGYDFILIDELQLFDSQERLAVSLLSRSKPGMKFLSVEDPSQGVFSATNGRSEAIKASQNIYLKETHRFRAGLFEFISFLYGQFALNAEPIKVSLSESKARKPRLVQVSDNDLAAWCVTRVREVSASKDKSRRICIVCIGEVEGEIYDAIVEDKDLSAVWLKSYDDVEKLSYQRRAAVVSSWQFVGGTQFTDVLLVVAGLKKPGNPHSKLRELTAIYLGASRASSNLDIVYDSRVPDVIQAAASNKLVSKIRAKV